MTEPQRTAPKTATTAAGAKLARPVERGRGPTPSAAQAPRSAADEAREARPMKSLLHLFSLVHALVALLFLCTALLLLALAVKTGWAAVAAGLDHAAALGIIEAMGVLTVAVVALQISQTIMEEEVIRDAHVSGPTRVRRFLSRFMVVVVIAIAIEALVGTFKAMHENPADLPYAASVLLAAAAVLAGWGVFIKLNSAAEELEPEAMEQAKSEDKKIDESA
jgi:hypothetical protein